ncbi:AAA family ATPase [Streptomyces flavofungini]|uniref:AAA family ATPase n=1 Tax=Streptomyces flavofungini TaxID=68200 RepID=UPI0025AF18E2|nr:AAA family ATPase [Streptomyces flavofungini]WJV47647.1 AAA family ATPase [Streptomyces flavofungini]
MTNRYDSQVPPVHIRAAGLGGANPGGWPRATRAAPEPSRKPDVCPKHDQALPCQHVRCKPGGAESTASGLVLPNGYQKPVEAERERFPRLDWDEAFATDFSQVDWLPGRFMERGQQVALVGDGKVGKTLFVHDWLWRCVTGRSFLGDEQRDPLSVLYFDRENSLRDIVTRMIAFGAKPVDLRERFDYRRFPRFSGGLDAAPIAVAELLEIVDETHPDVVVLDTVSRFIEGKENDADTWLSLYRRIHVPLKDRGVAGFRLDHMGKDTDRGSRGSSAKSQDVDHVWEMARTDEHHQDDGDVHTVTTQIRMKRTHTRTGIGDDVLSVTRRGRKGANGLWLPGETRHELSDPGSLRQQEQVIQSYVDELLSRNAPLFGRDKLRQWCSERGVSFPGRDTLAAEVTKRFKAQRDSRDV